GAGRLRLRLRRACGAPTRQHSCGRIVVRAAVGQRAVRPRSGARSLCLTVRRKENPGTHRAHAENRQAVAQLAAGVSSRARLGFVALAADVKTVLKRIASANKIVYHPKSEVSNAKTPCTARSRQHSGYQLSHAEAVDLSR